MTTSNVNDKMSAGMAVQMIRQLASDPAATRPPASGQNKTSLGRILWRMTTKGDSAYYEAFDKEIRAARPDWFVDTATLNKNLLRHMAATDQPRPAASGKNATKLGKALCTYTSESNPKTYDPVFTSELRRLNSKWFIRSDKVVATRKATKEKKNAQEPTNRGNEEQDAGAHMLQAK